MGLCGLSCDLHNHWRFCAVARKRTAGKVTIFQGDAAIDTWMDFNCQIVLVFQLNISFYMFFAINSCLFG